MSIAIEIKRNTHLVIKKDFLEALNEREREAFGNLCDKISAKYGNDRTYAICNADEPYYPDVMKKILDGEVEKIRRNKLGPMKDQCATS